MQELEQRAGANFAKPTSQVGGKLKDDAKAPLSMSPGLCKHQRTKASRSLSLF